VTFETKLKQWTTLGLGTVLMTGALAGCSESATPSNETPAEVAQPDSAETPDTSAAEPAAVAGEGESGMGGEGEGGEGEGGVSIEAAYTDPVVYKSAVAVAMAHVLAARDAFAEGEKEAAAEMYAHPVSEVLFDMEPVFQAQGVADFTDLFTDTSAAVFADESQDQINARTDAILKALDAAAAKAPATDKSEGYVSARVVADQINRASAMYRAALETDRYEPYLDGYGFYQTAEKKFTENEAAIKADNADGAAAIRKALTALSSAYPTALRPDSMTGDTSAISVANSEVLLSLSE
tara:strand:+ start:6041 stop:6925 length:885 start_codon:yes stop_codon:yes gene_type:complete